MLPRWQEHNEADIEKGVVMNFYEVCVQKLLVAQVALLFRPAQPIGEQKDQVSGNPFNFHKKLILISFLIILLQ